MSAVTIRPAAADDLACLSAIESSGVETFAAYGAPLGDASAPAAAGYWASHLAEGLLWIADDSGCGPIGFLAAERADGGLYIAEVDVIMDRQREGHGRRLVAAAIERARGERLSEVTLTTFRDIPWNAPFYERLGFRILAPDDTPEHLAGHLTREAARGLEGRCAMRLPL